MNIAIIFAGGVGKRMGNTEKPKQFMEIAEKPIIIHTLEVFEKCEEIDAIVVSLLADWIDYFNDLVKKYNITKVKTVVPGGETGQMSIFNGIKAAHDLFPEDSTVIINDGVRPFITEELIRENIKSVEEHGSAISCVPTTETFVITDENGKILSIPERSKSLVAKAPQSFVLKDIYETHLKAQADGIFDSIDSCTLMYNYKKDLATVMTDYDNIKITTPKDISLGQSIYERRHKEENV
jgi:2-C-methyl-D-erythritol 4-phosphate cytidylyltransferase